LITIRAIAISRNLGLPLHLCFTLRVAFDQVTKVAQAVAAAIASGDPSEIV